MVVGGRAAFRCATLFALIMLAACGFNGANDADDDAADTETEAEVAGVVVLSEEQRRIAGIVTESVTPQAIRRFVRAPGEVELNAYETAQVTPRIQAQVVARYVRLGDRVESGQPLVTLSSVQMAEAQSQVVIAEQEWDRVRELGREVVAGRRFLEAQVAAQQARATARSYGMTEAQVDELARDGNAELADGRLTLESPRDGTVIRDDFVIGEMIEPGRVLLEVSDESTRWVRAELSPEDAAMVSVGLPARVLARGTWIDGTVAQLLETIDEGTRRLPARIEVPTADDSLRPGLFVDVEIRLPGGDPGIALPEAAVLPTSDGEWEAFIEESPGIFRAVEVTVLGGAGELVAVDGIESGATVVTEGAFFLQSELGKAGFDIDDD